MRNLVQRDDLDGALFGAGAAIGALFGIDGGEEIGDGDGAGGANLGAHHAADAAGGADLADDSALIMAGATHGDMIFDRDHADEQVRAGFGAGAAAGASAAVRQQGSGIVRHALSSFSMFLPFYHIGQEKTRGGGYERK